MKPSFEVEEHMNMWLWTPKQQPRGDDAAMAAVVGTSRRPAARPTQAADEPYGWAAAKGYSPRAAEPEKAASTADRVRRSAAGPLTNKINEILRGK